MSLPIATRNRRGSAILIALLVVVVIAGIAGVVLSTTIPRYQAMYQVSGWQEARLAAEAGIDLALADLNRNLPDPTTSTANWSATTSGTWYRVSGTTLSAVSSGTVLAYNTSLPYTANGSNVQMSGTMALDNVSVITGASTARSAQVDVALQALYPVPSGTSSSVNPDQRWFRVRSLATTSLPPIRRVPIDSEDVNVHRFTLRRIRDAVWNNDFGTKHFNITSQANGIASASRVIEALVRPVSSGNYAILTGTDQALANSNGWEVDSWNSATYQSYASAPNIATGSESAHKGTKGNIGTLSTSTGAISGGNYDVWGNAYTGSGGTVTPTSAIHGNIANDFDIVLNKPTAPTSGFTNLGFTSGTSFIPGTGGTPNRYTGSSLALSYLNSKIQNGSGTIIIELTGNLTGGNLTIPPGVTLKIYVQGNIDFGSGNDQINTSGYARQLQIFGTGNTGSISANGTMDITAVLYAPTYDATYKGTVNSYGAICAKSFSINGGGNGGFHYDETLANTGAVVGYDIGTYTELNRF